jgi:alpha-glucosidase
LHLYRRLLSARKASPALRVGTIDLLEDLPDGVLGYERRSTDDHRIVLINFRDEPVDVGMPDLTSTQTVCEISSLRTVGHTFAGRLQAGEAVILRP